MIYEIMDLIDSAFNGAIKPYQQRLSLSRVLVVDGIDDNEDLARSLGELGLRSVDCNLFLAVKPKQHLESSGGEQVREEEEEEDHVSVGSDDPSDVEIIVDRPMVAAPRVRPGGRKAKPHRHIRQRNAEKRRRAEEERRASRGSGSDVEMAEACWP